MSRYISIRVDCPASDATQLRQNIHKCLAPLGTIVRGTYGHEVSLKAKKEHFHNHIQLQLSRPLPKAFSQWIKREYDRLYEIPLPFNAYSIKLLKEDPPTLDRWFRYPFKDLDAIDSSAQIGFTLQEQSLMLVAAKTEREITKKTFEKHENKLNNDKQSRKLLWEYLDSKLPHLSLQSDVWHVAQHDIATHIVQYNIEFNDYKIPMDLKRRTLSYMAYRGMEPTLIASIII